MKDLTGRYLDMVESFECDINLAMDPGERFCLDDLQVKIEDGDRKLLADIELLRELSYGLRHGELKITREG